MKAICAIILAAGESKRMGAPKMLLTFNGKTMLENVIDNVKMSDADNIMVVTGAHSGLLFDIISKSGVSYCYNDDYKDGMLSSVKCGFRNLQGDFEAVLVFQGDQPLITPDAINTVISAFRSSDKSIVIPVYNRRRGHPLLVSKKLFPYIEKLDASEGLRSLAYNFPQEVFEVETNDPGILRDFDTLGDYRNEINQIQ